jgi:TolA-binding protein
LLRLLIEEGNVAEAERRFATLQQSLPADQRADATRRLALAWARQGEIARADSLVLPDSSVAGLALRGRLRLFTGDVAGAVDLLKAAGPYAGTREEATERTALLALLQPLEGEANPRLGEAFLALAQGDTARAVQRFTELGRATPAAEGGAELTLLAGQLEARRGRGREAEGLLRAAADSTAPAAAPAALLELGRLLAQAGRSAEAVPVLEELILTYPRSALVPQARRALDDMKGAVSQ